MQTDLRKKSHLFLCPAPLPPRTAGSCLYPGGFLYSTSRIPFQIQQSDCEGGGALGQRARHRAVTQHGPSPSRPGQLLSYPASVHQPSSRKARNMQDLRLITGGEWELPWGHKGLSLTPNPSKCNAAHAHTCSIQSPTETLWAGSPMLFQEGLHKQKDNVRVRPRGAAYQSLPGSDCQP